MYAPMNCVSIGSDKGRHVAGSMSYIDVFRSCLLKTMHLKISPTKLWWFWIGLNVLKYNCHGLSCVIPPWIMIEPLEQELLSIDWLTDNWLLVLLVGCCWYSQRASYHIRKIAGCACAGDAGDVFPATYFKGNLQSAISACITARAWRTIRDACRDR